MLYNDTNKSLDAVILSIVSIFYRPSMHNACLSPPQSIGARNPRTDRVSSTRKQNASNIAVVHCTTPLRTRIISRIAPRQAAILDIFLRR